MSDNAMTTFPVEATQIMLFARALGSVDPVFTDITRSQEMVAPPTFAETVRQFLPEFEFRPDPRRPWVVAQTSDASLASHETTLHAEQHFVYHLPMKPGDKLVATTHAGKTWSKQGRNGAMQFFEKITEFRNETGTLVLTSTLVGVTIQRPTATSNDHG